MFSLEPQTKCSAVIFMAAINMLVYYTLVDYTFVSGFMSWSGIMVV